MSENKKLTRPQKGRKLAGVCAGLADFFGLDPTVVRLAYAFLTIFTAFAGVIAYLIAILVIPERNDQ